MKYWLAITALLMTSIAHGAWLSDWGYRAPVTSDATLVDEDIGVYRIHLSGLDAGFWANVNQTDGRDIRVTTSDGSTEIPVEIVGFDATADVGAIFFKGTGSTSADTTWYVYYGSPTASMPAITATYGAENVWTDFVSVHHFSETGGTTALDSTANDNDAVPQGTMTSADNVTGWDADAIAIQLDGTDDLFKISSAVGYDTDAFTLHLWVRKDGSGNYNFMGGGTDFTIGNRRFRMADNYGSAKFRLYSYHTYTGVEASYNSSQSAQWPEGSTWFQMFYTIDASTDTNDPSFIADDGIIALSVGTAPSGDRVTGMDSIVYGSRNDGTIPYSGTFSEIRWADSVRSANYISTSYAMENSPATFWTIGTQQSEADTDTGWVQFTVAAQSTPGSDTWSSPVANILTDQGTNSDVGSFSGGDTSYVAKATDASSALSAVAGAITGIEIEVEATGDDGGADEVLDNLVQLIVGGTLTGDDKSIPDQWTDAVHVIRTYGGQYDTWGVSLSSTQVTSSDFGFGFQVLSDASGAYFELWRVRLKVHYVGDGSTPDAAPATAVPQIIITGD